jgi:hypothetical protein
MVEKKTPTKKKTVQELNMDAIMSRKKPVTKRVTIQLDADIPHRVQALQDAITEAQRYDRSHNATDTAPALEKQMDELLAEAKGTEAEFIFASIGREAYDRIVEAHPPKPDQKKEGNQFDPETFPPALIAASCIQPTITPEQAYEIFNEASNWNGAELLRLFYAALEANTETNDIPLSRSGSVQRDNSLTNLLSLLSTESPTPST